MGGPEIAVAVGKLFGDVRRLRAKGVEIAFCGEIGLACDLIATLSGLVAFDLAETAAPIEQVIVLLEGAHGQKHDEGRRRHAHVHLIDDPGSSGFDRFVSVAEGPEGLNKIAFVARVQTNFKDAHKARIGKIDGLRTIAEIVAANSNNGALRDDEGLEFLLHARKFRTGCKDAPPIPRWRYPTARKNRKGRRKALR